MEDSNLLRDILFILTPAVLLATRSTSGATRSKVEDSVSTLLRAHLNQAARANSTELLSLAAFTFCGTLPSNQSRTALFRPSRS
jgi:hypothetical protein